MSNGAELARGFHVVDVVTTSAKWPNDLTFSATRLRAANGMPDRTMPAESDPSLLVTVMLAALPKGTCRYWVQGKEINVPFLPQYCVCISDMEANPATSVHAALDALHFYIPRASLDEISEDLGVRRLGKFSEVFHGPDPFMTQFTKGFLPYLIRGTSSDLLTIDYLALLLGVHLLQHYGKSTDAQVYRRGGLSAPQKRRATELLRANLAGRLTMKELANECGLSISYFARAFRVSFGISVHRWLVQQRLEHAKDLMLSGALPLADIALRSGFSDQSAFTRAFLAAVDVTPGKWRRAHSKMPSRHHEIHAIPDDNCQWTAMVS